MPPFHRLAVLLKHNSVLGLLLLAVLLPIRVVQAQDATPTDHIHRVIVHVNADFVPEGELSGPSSIIHQRSAIRNAQSALIADLERSRTPITTTNQFITIPYLALQVDDQGLATLQNNPNVIAIAEDRLYDLLTDSANDVVNASTAWNAGFDGTGQIVAVIDTGVDFLHPALSGKVVAEACFSNAGYDVNPFSNSACWNGLATDTGAFAAFPYGTYCLLGSCFHGTHVAGIVAGTDVGGNPSYDGGVAPGAEIIAINVFSHILACDCMQAYTSDVIRGLEHVYLLSETYPNIAAVNMSLGGGYYTGVCDWDSSGEVAVVDNLRSVGVAVIAASGNNGYRDAMSSPACFSNVISVGATDDSDIVASFSNHASFLDLYAPGVDITSTFLFDDYYAAQGTSMATPYVAGAWALVRELFPYSSVDDVHAVLRTGGHFINGPDGLQYPRLDVFGAFDYLPSRPADHSYNHRELLQAIQEEAEVTGSTIHPILIAFEVTQMTVYVEADGVHGMVPVTLVVGDDLSSFRYGSITTVEGLAAPEAYSEAISNGLPNLLSGAIDRLLDTDYPSGYDLDYAFVISTGLNLWVETP